MFQRADWYDEKISARLAYNKAILLAKEWDNDVAKKLLSSIDTLEKNAFSRSVLELQWDIAYQQKSGTWQIISYYDRSLEIEKHPRVSYKKSLLLDAIQQSKNTQSVPDKVTIDTVQDIQKNRSQYLNPQSDNLWYQKEELERIKQALGENNYTPIKDW